MTSDALSPNTTYATLPTDQINYMRNSVKAVVDAYDGTVDLYEWDEARTRSSTAWEEAFPDVGPAEVARSRRTCSQHMRYPEDLFKVQRNMLAALPRHRRQDVLRGQRPVEGAGGPRGQGEQAAAVPAVGADALGRPERRCSR